MSKKRKPMPPHWYRMHYRECPVCGYSEQSRERVYGEPPEDLSERYEYDQTGCALGGGCYSLL